MPLPKLLMYLEASKQLRVRERQEAFSDLSAAIASTLSGKGGKNYLNALEGEEDG